VFVVVIIQTAAVVALPAFFTEYYSVAEGIVDTGIRGKLDTACLYLIS